MKNALPRAKFTYRHHFIKEFNMRCDQDIIFDEGNFNEQLKFTVDYEIRNASYNEELDAHQGCVEYKLDVHYKKKKILHLIIWGLFSGDIDIPTDDFVQMLYNNGAPTISNIARAFIISASAHLAAGLCPIVVPMTNWFEFFENKYAPTQELE